MIESGVAVALGSDFNPGSCHIFSLPLIWGLACLHLRMTPQEALTALTVNSAHAIGRGDKIGQLKAGYQADIVVFDVATLQEIPYNLGWNPVLTVVKNGRIVSDKREH
jgi:imidazolonepropionase